MIKAYTIDSSPEQVSPESVVILDASISQTHPMEDDPTEAPVPWVLEAAREHFEYSRSNADGDKLNSRRLQSQQVKDRIVGANVVICAFDNPVQSSLDMVMSGIHATGAERLELPFWDNSSLVRLLDAEVWTYLANLRVLDTISAYDIRIFSGDTYKSLTEFKTALRRLVNSDVTGQIQEVEAIKETIFWNYVVESRSSFGLTGSNYTFKSGRQSSELETASNHTIPRSRARPLTQRIRSSSDVSELFKPRTMPFDEPKNTNKYTGPTGYNDSETSNSTEDGNRR